MSINDTITTKIKTTKVIDPTIKPPKIDVDKKLMESIKQQTNFEQQVIVHCFLYPEQFLTSVRIWRSTYLRDSQSSHRSKLLNAYNISFYPQWKFITGMGKVSFTLIFEALPKECTSFDLFEDIPNANGFFTGTINRKKSDVYQVKILY